MLLMIRQEFSETLTKLRTRAGLSNRDLAALAEVPHSFIAGLQSGRRRVGEHQARKIGLALGLTGEALDDFILSAVDTCTEKLLADAQGYPASLLNLVARQLRSAGIPPESLSGCECTGNGSKQSIRLQLQNGQTANLSTILAFS